MRVIDSTELSGVYATRLLAEMGHEVIRVEHPEGDALRRLPPFLKQQDDLEHGCYHRFLNAGKKSLGLDLHDSRGQETFVKLLAQADVLVFNDPLPFEDGMLFEANPRLVVSRIHESEPELCAMARSGLMSLSGHPGKAPVMLGGHVAYLAVGLYVAIATASALVTRQSTNKGSLATISVHEALQSFVEQALVEYRFSGVVTERRGSKGTITPLSGALPCRDGHWVISQIHRPGRWSKFMDWVQDPQLLSDPSLGEAENQRRHRDFIMERLKAWGAQFTKTELVEEAQRRHFPSSPVCTPLDLINDPQLSARGFLREMDHPEYGKIPFPQGCLANVFGTRLGPAPKLGEHNTEILSMLGLWEAK